MESTTVWPAQSRRGSQDQPADLDRVTTSHSAQGGRSFYSQNETFPEPQDTTFDPAHPRAWQSPVSTVSAKVYRQILGLNPFKTTYLSIFDSLDAWPDRLIALSGVTCAIAAGVPLPIIGLIFGKIINHFPPDEDTLVVRISQLLGVAAGYFAVTTLYMISFGLTSEKISIRLRERLLDCLLHLDQAYLDTHDIDVNALLTEKMDTVRAGCSEKVGLFIQSMSYFAAAFTVGFILNAKLTGILLASVVPALTLAFVLTSPAVSRSNRAASQFSEQANEIAQSALGAVKVVQAFDMIDKLCQKHESFLGNATRANIRKAIFAALQAGTVYFIAYSANGLAFYVGSEIASGGNAGTVYAVVFLIIDASFVVGQFAPFLEIFARAASAKGVVQDLLEARKAGTSSGTHHRNENEPDLHGLDVELSDVNFSYPARPTVKTLNGVNLKFRTGTLTALVGTSGGGKSTIVALILGIYNYSGHIRFGDFDVRGIDSSYLRSHIAVLDQDSILFTDTVFENVCYGLIGEDLSADEKTERFERAIRDAAVDFLDELPNGRQTRIGNQVQLSGGQKQRLCLARALIKKPSVLILDEPTSALDARSEVLVMEAVKKVAAAGTTVIMVAHRLSTVLDVDHVAVLSEGTVVEQGSPTELSRQGTVFRSLLDAQNTSMNSRQPSFDAGMLLKQESEAPQRSSISSEHSAVDDESDRLSEAPDRSNSWSLIKKVGSFVKADSWVVLLGVSASVVTGGLLIGEAIVFGNLVQLLNAGSDSPDYRSRADLFCLLFFILACIALVSYVSSGSAFGVTSTRLTARLQTRVLRRLLHLDLQWFSTPGHSVHELMGAFTKDPGDLSSLSGVALGTIFTVITSVLGGIILAHVVAWKIAVVLLSAVPVMILAGYTRLRILTVSETRHRAAYSVATGLAAEACRSRRAVTALSLEQHVLQEYKQALRRPYNQSRRFTVYANTLLAFCFAITYFVYALAYWWGSRQVRNGSYDEKAFFTVLPALLFSAQSAGQLFSLSPEMARAKTAARSVFALISAKSNIMTIRDHIRYQEDEKSTRSSTEKSLLTRSSDSAPKIQFTNVSLTYPGNTSKRSLKDVNLSIAAGKTVAFVGPSGAGKSSTVSLIERFFDPTAGSIHYDGHDIRHVDVRVLRSAMGLVSQEPDLFSGSITYNVKLGAAPNKEVTEDDVIVVCKRCGLHDFISSLPDGYNTECGSTGNSKLSGGQRQRLAIARALVRDPEILLLDEPTSALDAHSEATVQEALAEAAKGRTTIIVAHRLASIRHVDTIMVFDRGRLVAEGTHEELVQADGLYASMAKAQSLA